MKKLTALLLALMMACLLVPALAEDYTGEWYLVSVSAGSITVNPADTGISSTLSLTADGSITISYTQEDNSDFSTGSWEATETGIKVFSDDDVVLLIFADGVMTFGTEEDGLYTVSLLKDGALTISDGSEDLPLVLYFEKVAAEEAPAA